MENKHAGRVQYIREPADALDTVGDGGDAFLAGMTTASTPKKRHERSIAPRFCGSCTSSNATHTVGCAALLTCVVSSMTCLISVESVDIFASALDLEFECEFKADVDTAAARDTSSGSR